MPDSEIAEAYNGVVAGGENGAAAAGLHVENGAALKQQPVVPITYKAAKACLMIEAPKAAEALAFYKEAFGAEVVEKVYSAKRKAEQEEPRIMHAHIRLGETDIYLADEPEEVTSSVKSPAILKGTSFTLHLPTSDVDAAVARAVQAGATVEMEVADQFWGERYGMVVDPFGFSWGLATPLAKGPEDPAVVSVEEVPVA